MELHSKYMEKLKTNSESALKSASLRISVDKRRGRKNQKILNKLPQIGQSKNIRETDLAKFAKVYLAKVSTFKVI